MLPRTTLKCTDAPARQSAEILIAGCSLGNCVHIAGAANFLSKAETVGFKTELLGAAVSVDAVGRYLTEVNPQVFALGYRLSSSAFAPLLKELEDKIKETGYKGLLLFGGIPENVELAKKSKLFAYHFIGEESVEELQAVFDWFMGGRYPDESFLKSTARPALASALQRRPLLNSEGVYMPLIRHHFGLPDLEESIRGVEKISEAGVLDILSLAPDQNAQEFFFEPENMPRELEGAGGIPLRAREDLERLFKASQTGNRPYLRIYSGTKNLLQWAKLSLATLNNAWAAIPLCWYSQLDGRSKRPLEESMPENIETMRWYARHGVPVEVNEPHHWSLRDAPDVIAVAMAYISAYVAKNAGVTSYISQYMFNTPRFTSNEHDLAKMLSKHILISSLEDETFQVFRQVRAGLAHFSTNIGRAKGQLGMATALMMALRPHVLHVVGYTEADHAARPFEVIESCEIARGVLSNLQYGFVDPFTSDSLEYRVKELVNQAMLLIEVIRLMGADMGYDDPLAEPEVLIAAIRSGVLDAPHLKGQKYALGAVRTAPMNGGCRAMSRNGDALSEKERLGALLKPMQFGAQLISRAESTSRSVSSELLHRPMIECLPHGNKL